MRLLDFYWVLFLKFTHSTISVILPHANLVSIFSMSCHYFHFIPFIYLQCLHLNFIVFYEYLIYLSHFLVSSYFFAFYTYFPLIISLLYLRLVHLSPSSPSHTTTLSLASPVLLNFFFYLITVTSRSEACTLSTLTELIGIPIPSSLTFRNSGSETVSISPVDCPVYG